MQQASEMEFELCNVKCKQLIAKYGHNTPITEYPEKDRCVVLVWTSSGKIENGGFAYLFGASLPGDPYYQYTLNSFKVIGCDSAYDAVKKALCLFPKCKPPNDDYERIRYYRNINEEIRDRIDTQFWSSLEHITICLAQYIQNELNPV